MFMRGQEICSGAKHIHDSALPAEQMREHDPLIDTSAVLGPRTTWTASSTVVYHMLEGVRPGEDSKVLARPSQHPDV